MHIFVCNLLLYTIVCLTYCIKTNGRLKCVASRDGVEDTRLEAKAKDTKNPRPRSRTVFPRTDPLEAKDRNARGQRPRTEGQVFSERKSLQKFVSGEKGLKLFFSGDLQLRKTKKGLRKFSARFLAFSNKISTVQK